MRGIKQQKAAFVFNLLIVIFTLFATISTIIGFEFMGDVKILTATNFHAFKYFTVDSNVFAGIISFIYIIFAVKISKGKIQKFPKALLFLKLAATTGVTLTMMVTAFFLAPGGKSYFSYFVNSNFFMHFFTPVLCIISFIFFEFGYGENSKANEEILQSGKNAVQNEQISFLQTLTGIIPMLIYAVFYITNILLHLENGKVSHTYDWYGFLKAGLQTMWIVMPLILLITWLFSFLLWLANKKAGEKHV